MKYGNIKFVDSSNGQGVRVSLYVSGCRNHCKGCFNEATWDFDYGEEFTPIQENEIIEASFVLAAIARTLFKIATCDIFVS